jgi:carbonic anhydrase/acetyltransferase-like protein (isoleucine patch superfamily)
MIEDCALIGISAVVLNRVTIHTGSVVAAGAVVSEGAIVGPYELAAGVPATIKKRYPVDQTTFLRHEAQVYIDLAKEHMRNKSDR